MAFGLEERALFTQMLPVDNRGHAAFDALVLHLGSSGKIRDIPYIPSGPLYIYQDNRQSIVQELYEPHSIFFRSVYGDVAVNSSDVSTPETKSQKEPTAALSGLRYIATGSL